MDRELESYRLRHFSQHQVYEWLQANQLDDPWDEDREYLERELLGRSEPLTDLSLALFGVDGDVARDLYQRSDHVVRRALLRYHRSFSYDIERHWEEVIRSLIAEFDIDALAAYLTNPAIEDDQLVALYTKDGMYSSLNDEQWLELVAVSAANNRLSTQYDSSLMDGMTVWSYDRVFRSAWSLFAKLPVSDRTASILMRLGKKLVPVQPTDLDVMETIARWRIDSLVVGYAACRKALTRLFTTYSTEFRELAQSDDLALRQAYYGRFDASAPEEIRSHYQADGRAFIDEAIQNPSLYRLPEVREELGKCCWDCAGEHDQNDLLRPSLYKARLTEHQKEHREWFEGLEAVDDGKKKPFEDIQEELQRLIKRFDTIAVRMASKRVISWGWFAAGLAVGLIIQRIL